MTTDLPAALRGLREALVVSRLALPLAGVDVDERTRAEVMEQIDDYLLPRLLRLDAPLLAVLGGSTGAGKSTITSSLVGATVTESGVLRPTTRAPVLVCHPDDAAWFLGDDDSAPRLLPELPRAMGEPAGGRALHVRPHRQQPRGLALLDSPDIDSVETANHVLAAQLLGAADLWLFVTSAARYADAVGWDYLDRAQERGAALAVILNRIPAEPGAAETLAADVHRLLAERGLGGVQVFTVAEGGLRDGRVGSALDPVRQWLGALVDDAGARRALVRRTLDGALASLAPRVARVADALEDQAAATEALAVASVERYAQAHDRVRREIASGALLHGEVLDRFAEHVGTAAWMDRLQRGVGRLRDRVRGALSGQQPPAEEARGRLGDNLVTLLADAVASAAEATVERWRTLPGGTELMAGHGAGVDALRRPAAGTEEVVADAVGRWQEFVLELVREKAGSRVAVARGLTLGVNGAGVALMMSLFASTGGITGGEVAVAGGTAAVSQAVLGAIFGEQAVRELSRMARGRLLEAVERLLEEDRQRFEALLADLPGVEDVVALRAAAALVEEARHDR